MQLKRFFDILLEGCHKTFKILINFLQMRKYYFITLFAIISIAILQVYNITLQYKEYCNNNIGYLTDVLKKSLDEEFALRTQHNHQKIKKQGSQRFYYQRIPVTTQYPLTT